MLDFDIERENTILFIDEIQECEALISELKYFCEKHNSVRIICAGSLLGVSLKRSKRSFPVGKVKMLRLYPMDFEEFLMAMDQELLIEEIRMAYKDNIPLVAPIHEKALNLYRTYLITGGMPESVLDMVQCESDYINFDVTIIENILQSYLKDMSKYVVNPQETLKINHIYNSLPTLLSNLSNKFQFSKIKKNARMRDYDTALDWLIESNMVLMSKKVTLPEIPLAGFVDGEVFKIYLSDIGILNNLLGIKNKDILMDNISLYKGSIVENYVAIQLVCKGFPLYYCQSDGKAKIDFLIYNDDGIIPIEVKAGDAVQSKSLQVYIEKFKSKYAIRISTRNFGYDENKKIKSIPLYAVFCI